MANSDVPAAGEAGRELIVRLAFGSMAAQTLRAAVRLRVVELMGDTPRQATEVAEAAGAAPQPMARLLRALSALGLLEERAPGTFAVTPAGALLHPEAPGSVASFVRMFTDPALVRAWEHLDDSVRTGEVAFDAVFGTDFFSHLGRHPELSAEFNAAMSQAVAGTAAVLPHAFDFGRFRHVTDVGGGDGTLLAGCWPPIRTSPARCSTRRRVWPGRRRRSNGTGWAGGALRSPGTSSARCPRARTSTW